MVGQQAVSPAGEQSVRVGVIGASKRAAIYFRDIPSELRDRVRLVALADPDGARASAFARLVDPDSAPAHHRSGRDLLDQHELDAVIIGSPNRFHTEDAVRALAQGVPTLLEKPVAVSLEQARDLWAAHRETGADMIVGFVLRYSPFYSTIKEIIDSGELGEILAIDALESLGTALTGVFHKGWRVDDAVSGGFLLEKCCHDLDILNWLIGARATRVFSMARRSHFRSRPASERHEARFESVTKPVFDADYGDDGIKEALFTPAEGSPYDIATTNPDHQMVMIEYENDVLASLTVCMAQPRNTRKIAVYGANGSLEGDIGSSRIRVLTPHENGNGHDARVVPVVTNSSGHHGADAFLSEALWHTAAGRPTTAPRAGLLEGIESVLLVLAAQESASTGMAIDVQPARETVYR